VPTNGLHCPPATGAGQHSFARSASSHSCADRAPPPQEVLRAGVASQEACRQQQTRTPIRSHHHYGRGHTFYEWVLALDDLPLPCACYLQPDARRWKRRGEQVPRLVFEKRGGCIRAIDSRRRLRLGGMALGPPGTVSRCHRVTSRRSMPSGHRRLRREGLVRPGRVRIATPRERARVGLRMHCRSIGLTEHIGLH